MKNQGTGNFKKRKKKIEPDVNSRLKDYNWIEIQRLIDGLNSRLVVAINWKEIFRTMRNMEKDG